MSDNNADKPGNADRRSHQERRSGVKRTAIILAVVALGIYAVSLYQSFSGAGA